MTDPNELLGDWLDREVTGVPQELVVRIRAALPADWRTASIADAPAILTGAAAKELRRLLERGCETRWAAPGLLTVDALVTYACQVIALTGADVESAAMASLKTITSTLP